MKKSEIINIGLASASVLTAFSFLFVMLQRAIIHGALQGEIISYNVEAMQIPTVEAMVPQWLETPAFEIWDWSAGEDLGELWLRAEEAAHLANHYIETLVERSALGMFFSMGVLEIAGGRPWWQIIVSDESSQQLYILNMDAINGELLSFSNQRYFLELENFQRAIEMDLNFANMWDSTIARVEELLERLGVQAENINLMGYHRLLSWDYETLDRHLSFWATSPSGADMIITVSQDSQKLVDFQTFLPAVINP